MSHGATPAAGQTVSACKRCGQCCEKGGPAFHLADRALLEKGVIPSSCLYTIRKGELAWDNVNQRLMPVDTDVIKIKGKKGGWACIFFDEIYKSCTIYENRPLECRVLKCWDPGALERIYAAQRLTRRDLISRVEGLWDLVQDHQVRCNHEKIQRLVQELEEHPAAPARRKLSEIIRYDAEIRKLVVSRGGLQPDMLDFLFGRPLSETIKKYGVRF
jgi:Fe-S-cluster containining protein